jgi:hypothetical protein
MIRPWSKRRLTGAEKPLARQTRCASARKNYGVNKPGWRKSIERLINAYQEGLVTLPQLRHRMPELRRQIQAVESELHSL